jgi:hypothetical protein
MKATKYAFLMNRFGELMILDLCDLFISLLYQESMIWIPRKITESMG